MLLHGSMRSRRLKFLRAILAVLLGFVSMAHAPAMASWRLAGHAAALSAPQTHTHEVHAGHGMRHNDIAPAPDAAGEPTCYGFGCFVAIQADAPETDAALFVLDSLAPGFAPIALSIPVIPADPPPRA
jgi:hypothetical protein